MPSLSPEAAFHAAAEQNAVLLFDEADAIARRRSSGSGLPHQRESNLMVNVLLGELEAFNGIVIFSPAEVSSLVD